MQYAVGYSPIKIRTAIIPVTQIGSYLSWPLLLIGLLLGSETLAMAGVLLFCAVVAFQLVTLPVEFNASNRALDALGGCPRVTGRDISSLCRTGASRSGRIRHQCRRKARVRSRCTTRPVGLLCCPGLRQQAVSIPSVVSPGGRLRGARIGVS